MPSFIEELQAAIRWTHEDAERLSREDLLDGARARFVALAQRFVAYPHCSNFSLMPEDVDEG
jgi:hypothetical protein